MAKSLLVVAILACSCDVTAPQPIALQPTLDGRWLGTLEFRARTNPMVFDFYADPQRWYGFSGPPDSPEAATMLRDVRFDAPRISFTLADGPARLAFEGTLADGAIRATARAGEHDMQLELRRQGDAPPAPYKEESIEVARGETTLAGTFLLPSGSGPHPAIVLIHGTGRQTRDEWRHFGALFARHGFAALLYDKRDVGHDASGMDLVGLDELADDALAAVALLRARSDIRHDAIGLWGISQGGWVAPIAAAKSNDVSFVISVSGPGVSYAEVNLFAIEHRLRANAFADTEITRALTALRSLDDYVRGTADAASTTAMLAGVRGEPWFASSTLTSELPTPIERQTWLRWRDLDLDPATYWERVKVPVFLIYGERDDVVPVARSIERITAALARAGNARVTVNVFPGADHLVSLQPVSPEAAGPPLAPGFADAMTQWLSDTTSMKR